MSKNEKNKRASKKELQQQKHEEVVEKLDKGELLGNVITWNASSEETRRFKDVVNALKAADLDPKIARELLPRFAFTRAAKQLTEIDAIDVIKETDTEIRFQFTKKLMRNDEWEYKKDTELTLNKTTGDVHCPKRELQEKAKTLLDEAMDVRTTSDITKIVQRLFEKNADLFPLRDQGGVYFVPVEHVDFINKVDSFLKELGGSVRRLPVPTGTTYGNKAVQDTVAEAMQSFIKEHLQAIDQFTINTRKDTIEHQAAKIRETRVKIEAYANYLMDRRDELLQTIDEANVKLTEKVSGLQTERENMPEGSGGFLGHSVTAVIRWMGKQGWKFGEIKGVLKANGLSIAEATIRAQSLAGRNGTRGDPATLSDKQIKQIEKQRKEAGKSELKTAS